MNFCPLIDTAKYEKQLMKEIFQVTNEIVKKNSILGPKQFLKARSFPHTDFFIKKFHKNEKELFKVL